MRTRAAALKLLVPACALALVAAACGSKSSSKTTEAPATTAATTEAPATTMAGTEAPATTAAGELTLPAACDGSGTGLDASHGVHATKFIADIECAETKPLKAAGDPVVIGVQNPEGDPNGSFPEYSLAAKAAADYINNELGGIGGDPSKGIAGRPIELQICKMAITPADSQRCANELVGKKPYVVLSTLNFFGNHFPIYAQAGVSVIVGTPITVGDFTDPSTFSIGAGGGCLGVHTGLIWAATQPAPFLAKKNIAVPWSDTPPGVVCYYDLEQKPLQVLKGEVKGTSKLAGSMPDIKYIKDGVPIKPATPDITAQVTQVLGSSPEAIVFSAQGADCWNLVDGLGKQGWTPDKIPLLLSGACIDFEKMKAAGDLAKGVYFVGSAGAALANADAIADPVWKAEAKNYLTKTAKYGMSQADILKGFATQGFTAMMTIWEQTQISTGGDPTKLDAAAFKAEMKKTHDSHIAGSVPFGCADAAAPYVAVCNQAVSFLQWDGTKLNTIVADYSATDLIAGTELIAGPK
jgi:branched-chain amino acid transport system substrate-binding protein